MKLFFRLDKQFLNGIDLVYKGFFNDCSRKKTGEALSYNKNDV